MVSRQALLAGMVFGLTLGFISFKLHRHKLLIFLFCVPLIWRISISEKSPDTNPETSQGLTAKQVEQLDVGQGDSALIHYQDVSPKWGLIDTGSTHALSDTAWLQVLMPRGIHRLSWVALTHLDEDHTGGLLRLARIIPIDCVVTSDAELRTERGRVMTERLLKNGIRIKDWGAHCVPFPYLAPLEGPEDRSANARMSALWIPLRAGGFYLSAGDATVLQEKRITKWAWRLANASQRQQSGPRILKISHHGSKTSTHLETLKLIKPTQAWVSVGVGNNYGHPHPQVMQRLYNAKIPVRRTDLHGRLSTTEFLQLTPKKGDVRHRQRGSHR